MHILMLTESGFPCDIRPRQEAYLLVESGYRVSIICLRDEGEVWHENISGVNVYRLPKLELFKRGKQKVARETGTVGRMITLLKGILGYGFEYLYFTSATFLVSLYLLIKDRFDVIHTHNPPDSLFIVAFFFKLFGKSYVYDHHDLSPDLFIEKYGSKAYPIYRILLLLEKLSCKLADRVIATNESYKDLEIRRNGINGNKIYVVRNGPNLKVLKPSEPVQSLKSQGKKILCYLGSINNQDGVDYLVIVLSKLVHRYNYTGAKLLVIGDGDYLDTIRRLATDLDVDEFVEFTGYIHDSDTLCRYLSTADIFVDAAPESFYNHHSTFIKHMEYMIFNKPIMSFTLKESMFSLGQAAVFIPDNDTDLYAQKIIELIEDKEEVAKITSFAGKRIKELSWENVSKPLLSAYEKLANA